jgi:hypothetical protein
VQDQSPPIGLIEENIKKRDRAIELITKGLQCIQEAQQIAPEYALNATLGNDVS